MEFDCYILGQKRKLNKFMEYLGWDGLLLLKMIDFECGAVFGTDLVLLNLFYPDPNRNRPEYARGTGPEIGIRFNSEFS